MKRKVRLCDELHTKNQMDSVGRRNSIDIFQMNPKPLVGLDSPRRRRHSAGSQEDLCLYDVKQRVGEALIGAASRRGIDERRDRSSQEYRIRLSDSCPSFIENSPHRISQFSPRRKRNETQRIQSIAELDDSTDTEMDSNESYSSPNSPEKVFDQNAKKLKTKWPKWQPNQSIDPSKQLHEQLHDEILNYAKYTKSIVQEMTIHIEEAIHHVRKCVSVLWPNASVETFGSYATGLWLPSSDIDLVVLNATREKCTSSALFCLQRLSKVLEEEGWVKSLVLLETAKVPVIKIVCMESSVPIDITFESTATHSGLMARDLIIQFRKEIKELYPLSMVLKQFLRERGMNAAYTGGLSSYSTSLMIIHFIQLWRAGKEAFEAASIYASGDIPSHFAGLNSKGTKNTSNNVKNETSLNQNKNIVTDMSFPKPIKKEKPSYASALISPTNKSKETNKLSYAEAAKIVQSTSTNEDSVPSCEDHLSKLNLNSTLSYADVALRGKINISNENEKKSTINNEVISYAKVVAQSKSTISPSKYINDQPKTALIEDPKIKKENSDPITLKTEKELDNSNLAKENNSSISETRIATNPDIIMDSCMTESRIASLGEHLINLLEFFGIIFNFSLSGMSIRNGGYIYRLQDIPLISKNRKLALSSMKSILVIEDPIHPTHNVGASTFAIENVVRCFEDSYYALRYFQPSRFTPTILSSLLSCEGHESIHQELLYSRKLYARNGSVSSSTSSETSSSSSTTI